MPHALVERLAEKMVHEVRDETLGEAWQYFFTARPPGTTGRTIHDGLVAGLDPRQKDLLWKLLEETVEHSEEGRAGRKDPVKENIPYKNLTHRGASTHCARLRATRMSTKGHQRMAIR